MQYKVKLEKTDDGYAVWCPSMPGCWSQGKTVEETMDNVKYAIHAYLRTVDELSKDKETCYVEV